MNKPCWLIVISLLLGLSGILYIYYTNPVKWVPMVVSGSYLYLQSGNSYVITKYCKVDDPIKCLIRREMRFEPNFTVGTKVQLRIRENLELDHNTIKWLDILLFVVFIELCIGVMGAVFMGTVYVFTPKVETNRRYLL